MSWSTGTSWGEFLLVLIHLSLVMVAAMTMTTNLRTGTLLMVMGELR